jgi:hypothetical protein
VVRFTTDISQLSISQHFTINYAQRSTLNTFFTNNLHLTERSPKIMKTNNGPILKCRLSLHVTCLSFLPNLNKNRNQRLILIKIPNTQVYENPFSGSQVAPCGQTKHEHATNCFIISITFNYVKNCISYQTETQNNNTHCYTYGYF